MFKKILIANRGEIACRVAATASRLAIKTVAVYSDADRGAKHVSCCDQAIHIGGSAPQDSYLRWERIIAAAQTTGAQAIHPGYGFLSENADFAQACSDAGLVFIGPPVSAIQAMGLKAESKRLLEKAGVPLVPGYHGSEQSPQGLKQEAERMGYPVLIKASAGGGGKGMRVVEKTQDFDAALASCQREAMHSFGDAAVLLEKYVQPARHIEIQVFGDMHGNYVYLFERDCSVQRRYQKVLEEAPAPGMTAMLRQQMGEAAVAVARAVHYVGAGTVEFIVKPDAATPAGSVFYFMEMNTRLQVEHPVTEAITGLDLVAWQLQIACGEPLPLTQSALRIHGHAIEARICAETPDNHFLPATGRLEVYDKPAATSFETGDLRVDDGVRQGDMISPFYDAMVAKLIVHGRTRDQALARLDQALAQTRIVGLNTNVQFLRYVLRSPSFVHANIDTALIERESAVLLKQEPVGLTMAVAAAVAQTLVDEQLLEGLDPFSRRDGWRMFGVYLRHFEFEFHGQAAQATLSYERDARFSLTIDDVSGPLLFAKTAQGLEVQFAGQQMTTTMHRRGDVIHLFSAVGATQITVVDSLVHARQVPAEGGRLTAPMPGKVVSFGVQAGDKVSKGQPLAVIEAMKMEHTMTAPAEGIVQALLYAPGDHVSEGAELLKMVFDVVSGIA